MKNYYEILEINEKASQEIIEKVYKVLVKKYHPDLQETAEGKAKCEEKIKEINEAYDILSNSEKRAEYDATLAAEITKSETSNNQYQNSQSNQQQSNAQAQSYNHRYAGNIKQNQNYSQEQARQQAQREVEYKEQLERERQYQQDYQNAVNKAYHDAYIQDLKRRGYKIRYKKTLNDYIRSMIAILITIGIIFLICQIPFVRNYLHELYNNNIIIHNIIDFFGSIFNK